MDKIRISIYELLLCLSNTQAIVHPHLSNHHQQVAYLSFRLAEQLGLSLLQQKKISLAALVHDIGALSENEKLEILEAETVEINKHAFRGANLIEEFTPLAEEATYIKYHHIPWNSGEGLLYQGNAVPFASHIIHLADRVCTMFRKSKNILSQIPKMLSEIEKGRNTVFEPSIIDALHELSIKEYIWLDLISQSPEKKLPVDFFDMIVLDMDDLINLSSVFSHIIDFRSKFTARHSAGVAKTAQRIAELVGFAPTECKMMLVAGYLHDLGKIAISNHVLEKSAKLNVNEFNEIRSHAYYTYRMLDTIPQFETIKTWASFHHERLDGKGYPFHIKGDNLSLGARIMAVADIFTAITENRPYRIGMEDERAITVLNNMVKNGAIDKNIVDILIKNFHEINNLREDSQRQASEQYEKFLQI